MKSINPGVTGRSLDIPADRDHPTEAEIRQLAIEYDIELGRAYRPARHIRISGTGTRRPQKRSKAERSNPPIPFSDPARRCVAWPPAHRHHLAAAAVGREAEANNRCLRKRTGPAQAVTRLQVFLEPKLQPTPPAGKPGNSERTYRHAFPFYCPEWRFGHPPSR